MTELEKYREEKKCNKLLMITEGIWPYILDCYQT